MWKLRMMKFIKNNWAVKHVFYTTNYNNTIRIEKDNEKEYLFWWRKLKLCLQYV